MTAITAELMAHISRRNTELHALIARYNLVRDQIATLATETKPLVEISVHVVGKHFPMMVPVEVLRAQHEDMLATLAQRILDRAASPMDDMPMPVTAPEPDPAAELPPPPFPEGATDHG